MNGNSNIRVSQQIAHIMSPKAHYSEFHYVVCKHFLINILSYYLKPLKLRLFYEGHLESKERFAIQRYLLIIGKKQNMQVL